jgi:hypothetical protein
LQASGQDGYTTTTGVPPQSGGDLPHTGADLGPIAGLGALLLFGGAMIWAAVTNARRSQPAPAVAPAYLRDKTGRDPDDPRYS